MTIMENQALNLRDFAMSVVCKGQAIIFHFLSKHFHCFGLDCLKTCVMVPVHILSDYDRYMGTLYFRIRVGMYGLKY